jgi:hypothetical protein
MWAVLVYGIFLLRPKPTYTNPKILKEDPFHNLQQHQQPPTPSLFSHIYLISLIDTVEKYPIGTSCLMEILINTHVTLLYFFM